MKTTVPLNQLVRRAAVKSARTADCGPSCLSLHRVSVRVFLLTAICVLLPAASLQAQNRLLTLAMLRPDDRPVRRLATDTDHLTLGIPASAPIQAQSEPGERLNLLVAEKFALSIRDQQLWRHDVPAVNSVSLSRMSLREFGRPNVWASFEAGYGQLFTDRSPLIYGRNGSAFEEPSCGYFRLCFSF